MRTLNTDELDQLHSLYARDDHNKYAPAAVVERTAQIRSLIEEVKMWRESAGTKTEN